jgi:anti-sigma regulatory factor (Ser/Thr protein kinase)
MATPPEKIELRLPSRLELLTVVDRVVLAACERMGFDEDAISAMSMAVLEAGSNAVQHAHGRDPSKMFEVDLLMHDDRLEVEVRDRGADSIPPRRSTTSPRPSTCSTCAVAGSTSCAPRATR